MFEMEAGYLFDIEPGQLFEMEAGQLFEFTALTGSQEPLLATVNRSKLSRHTHVTCYDFLKQRIA